MDVGTPWMDLIPSHAIPSLCWAPDIPVEALVSFLLPEGKIAVTGPQDAIPVLRQNIAAFSVQHNSLHAADPGTDVKFGSAYRLFCNRGSE